MIDLPGFKWDPVGDIDKGLKKGAEEIKKGVGQIATNVEQNIAGQLKEYAYALGTGDFSNLDQTILRTALFSMSPQALMLNPDTVKYKETNIQRGTREAQEKAAIAEMQASAAKEQERLKGFADFFSAAAQNRRTSPGMSQTLLGSGTSDTLLTIKR